MSEMGHKKDESGTRRVQVTFTAEQWSLINKFRGILGNSDSEIIRNIILSWLSEKSIISSEAKKKNTP